MKKSKVSKDVSEIMSRVSKARPLWMRQLSGKKAATVRKDKVTEKTAGGSNDR